MMRIGVVGKPIRWIKRVIQNTKKEKKMSHVVEAHSKQMKAILDVHRRQMEAVCAWNADEVDMTYQRYNIGLTMILQKFTENLEAICARACEKAACSQRPVPGVIQDMPHLFPIKGGILLEECRSDSQVIITAPSPPKPCLMEKVPVQDEMPISDDDAALENTECGDAEKCQHQDKNDAVPTHPPLYDTDNSMLVQLRKMKDSSLAWALREVDRYTDDEEELDREAKQAWERSAREERKRIKQSLKHQMKQMPYHRKSNYKMNGTFFAPM
jgi:hypothetical protein